LGQSEVARIREQIEAEMMAMRRGMYGFAAGTARHDFIKARMDNIGNYQEKLAEHVGNDEAWQSCAQIYMRIEEEAKARGELRAPEATYLVVDLCRSIMAECAAIANILQDTTIDYEQRQERSHEHRAHIADLQCKLAQHIGEAEAARAVSELYQRATGDGPPTAHNAQQGS
jgi:hypothetical protein